MSREAESVMTAFAGPLRLTCPRCLSAGLYVANARLEKVYSFDHNDPQHTSQRPHVIVEIECHHCFASYALES